MDRDTKGKDIRVRQSSPQPQSKGEEKQMNKYGANHSENHCVDSNFHHIQEGSLSRSTTSSSKINGNGVKNGEHSGGQNGNQNDIRSEKVNDGDDVLKFEINEKVYVHERNQVYFAKVLKTRFRTTKSLKKPSKRAKLAAMKLQQQQQQQQETQQQQQEETQTFRPYWEYLIHFNGWSARHDKWCREEIIMKDGDQGRKLAELSKEREKLEELKRKEKKEKIKNKKKNPQKTGRKRKSCSSPPPSQQKQVGDNENGKSLNDGAAAITCGVSGGITNGKNERQSLHKPNEKTFAEYCTLPFTLQSVIFDDRTKLKRLGRHVAMGYDHIVIESTTSTIQNGRSTWKPSRMVHNLPVPANVTVKSILEGFVKSKRIKQNKTASYTGNGEECDANGVEIENKKSSENRLIDVDEEIKPYKLFCKEMIRLFDSTLPKFLLYKEEREQFNILWKQRRQQKNTSCVNNASSKIFLSRIYGGEFLLRLLVRLPMFITSIDNISLASMSSYSEFSEVESLITKWKICYQTDRHKVGKLISELIIFLQKNKNKCFKGNYRTIIEEEYTDFERDLLEQKKVCKE